jgi:hypothetical protein
LAISLSFPGRRGLGRGGLFTLRFNGKETASPEGTDKFSLISLQPGDRLEIVLVVVLVIDLSLTTTWTTTNQSLMETTSQLAVSLSSLGGEGRGEEALTTIKVQGDRVTFQPPNPRL